MDFLYVFFDKLYSEPSMSLSSVAKEAYSKGLGPHHPWAIRQGAKLAMLACPGRDSFFKHTGAQQEELAEVRDLIGSFRVPLQKLFAEKGYDKLP